MVLCNERRESIGRRQTDTVFTLTELGFEELERLKAKYRDDLEDS